MNEQKPTSGKSIQQVQRDPPLSEKVSDALVSYILESGLKPGDRLPSERELCEQFNVSRTVVREAVRSVIGKGLIQSHSGARLTVSAVATKAVSDVLNLFLHGRKGIDGEPGAKAMRDLHEVRSMIETQIARRAAERATEEEIAAIAARADDLLNATTDDQRIAADEEFHRMIANASHNEFYLMLLDSLVIPLRELRRETLKLKQGGPDAAAAHARILSKIAAHDAEGARAAMEQHIQESGMAIEQIVAQQLSG